MSQLPANAPKTALVLTGGGARAAYQVGVLLAVAKLSTNRRQNPFPILCGTSAGAINAASIACLADNFGKAVAVLASFWRNMRAGDIYRADPFGIGVSGAHWMTMLTLGWLIRSRPRSLLDNSPLRDLLSRHLDFRGVERSIASGALHALSISASGYESGDNINFFQGHPDAQPWHRVQRIGIRSEIGVDHLLASSAIPFIFPATKIHREFFGDGSMRQLAPISPAIHLGAERVLIIGAGRKNEHHERRQVDKHPSLAQIAGHALSSIFLAAGDDYYELPSPDGESANPWQSNLDRLAERTPDHQEAVSSSTEIEEQFQVLMEQAKIEKIKQEAAKNFERGEKRKADATVTDAKAWWGQSVATWEPLDGKNIDNIEQRRHPRQSKWFQS